MVSLCALELQRFDIALGECSIEETGEGYLKLKGIIAKPGIYPYLENGRIVRELVSEDELFSTDTIQSADGVPLTDDHPMQDGIPIMLSSGDASIHAKGTVYNPAIEDGKLCTRVSIWDAACIQAAVTGERRQLSIGRTTVLDDTPGTWNGQSYDRKQTRIRINHVAMVDRGRQGPEVKFLIDRGESMLTYRTDKGTDAQVSEETMADIQARNKRIAELEAKTRADADELSALAARLAAIAPSIPDPKGEAEKQKLMAQIEALTAQVAGFEEKYKSLTEQMPQMVEEAANEKMQLSDALKSVDPAAKVDGLSPREIRLAVIQKVLPFEQTVKPETFSDEVVKGRFDAAMDLARMKANLQGGRPSARTDREQIEANRAKMQDMYNFDRKEAK